MTRGLVLTVVTTLALAGCTAPRKAPTPAAPPPPPIPALLPPPPSETDWRDLPLTPGSWTYAHAAAGSVATYGPPGGAMFALRCDQALHVVALTRPAAAGAAMTTQTSYASRTIPATNAGGAMVASLAARDQTLDQIAFSRGRFSIAVAGLPTLYLPAWAEPARVIEDCR